MTNEESAKRICPSCNAEVEGSVERCPECGGPLESDRDENMAEKAAADSFPASDAPSY